MEKLGIINNKLVMIVFTLLLFIPRWMMWMTAILDEKKAKTAWEPPAKNVVNPNPFLALTKGAPEHLVKHPKSKKRMSARIDLGKSAKASYDTS